MHRKLFAYCTRFSPVVPHARNFCLVHLSPPAKHNHSHTCTYRPHSSTRTDYGYDRQDSSLPAGFSVDRTATPQMRARLLGPLVSIHVHVNSTARRVSHLSKSLIPCNSHGGTACHGRAAGHSLNGAALGEVCLEDGAVEVALLGGGRVVGEPVLGVGKLGIGDHLLGVLLEPIDPAVAHTVRELLLLAPEHLVRQVRVVGGIKCLAHHPLLHLAPPVSVSSTNQLVCGVHPHGNVEECLVKERHTSLNTPCAGCLVGAQAVVHVQGLELTNGLLLELLAVGGLVEVQVAPKHLVGTLPRQHHLDPHGLDLARHQVHGRGRTHRRDIVCLEVVDDVRESVDTVLDREGELVVPGAQELCDLACSKQIGGLLQTHRERVEGPPRDGRLLHVQCRELFLHQPRRNRRNKRRVQPAGKEHAVWHVRHQTLGNRSNKRVVNGLKVEGRLGRDVFGVPVDGVPVGNEFVRLAIVVVTGGELLKRDAVLVDGFELRGKPHRPVATAAVVEGGHTNGVPSSQKLASLLIAHNEAEHAIKQLHQVRTHSLVHVHNNLTVGGSFIFGIRGILFP
eukprot:comp11789_c0_seq1/m.6394 comp11789_c0_seq1/g.6394  ORF comp11789_c0_seq1/g.6394 comp11789_c0_seq1/m.6394 type:complete len:565 (+) comp11789_c0_seq1:267-1961(+)